MEHSLWVATRPAAPTRPLAGLRFFNNATGGGNTAIGESALVENITGNSNTAVGVGTMHSAAGLNSNTAVGVGAL